MALSMISNLRMHAVSATFGFLRCAQSNVKGLQHWIASGRYQRAHVERRAELRATAPDCACPTHLAAVAVERRDSHQGGKLVAAKSAELRQWASRAPQTVADIVVERRKELARFRVGVQVAMRGR